MTYKRIIPCLDIRDGRTVKGINFENIKEIGDPVELALAYEEMGADELVFLDITATNEKKKTLADLIPRIAASIHIPFTIGGGITSLEDAAYILEAGASKISISTAAVKNPLLIQEIATHFGSYRLVLAIDVKKEGDDYFILTHGGKVVTNIKAIDWAKKTVELGAGEILLTSLDRDGTKAGFDLEITKAIAEAVDVPIIASGGAGTMEHFAEVFQHTKADAALAASIFHYKEVAIPELKRFLGLGAGC